MTSLSAPAWERPIAIFGGHEAGGKSQIRDEQRDRDVTPTVQALDYFGSALEWRFRAFWVGFDFLAWFGFCTDSVAPGSPGVP